ncbi:hypothetical protein [Victivallis vadensis]|uniref:hypothetical protein n=1 Tax=Victivallis vadensis TaxID=172901 RepID=UPI0023F2EEF4|nr:hypothetical protein [Victivallis vadensis]
MFDCIKKVIRPCYRPVTEIIVITTVAMLPLIISVLVLASKNNNYWECILTNIKNCEFFLLALSFLASAVIAGLEALTSPKLFFGRIYYTLVTMLVFSISIVFIVLQRTNNDPSSEQNLNVNLIFWLSLSCLILAMILYGIAIGNKPPFNFQKEARMQEESYTTAYEAHLRERR